MWVLWPAKVLRRDFRGPTSRVGLSNHINISTTTFRNREEKVMSWETRRCSGTGWNKIRQNYIKQEDGYTLPGVVISFTWYRCSWRIRGQESAWLRCIDITIGPAWVEVSRDATACRRRKARPPCWICPCLARISSLANACCKVRESWLGGGPCQRGSTFIGKIWRRHK